MSDKAQDARLRDKPTLQFQWVLGQVLQQQQFKSKFK